VGIGSDIEPTSIAHVLKPLLQKPDGIYLDPNLTPGKWEAVSVYYADQELTPLLRIHCLIEVRLGTEWLITHQDCIGLEPCSRATNKRAFSAEKQALDCLYQYNAP
jgi:hypothetical protein